MRASEVAAAVGGTLEGEDVDITACAGLEEARKGDLSFCKDPKHVALVEGTLASAVLLPPDWSRGAPCSVMRHSPEAARSGKNVSAPSVGKSLCVTRHVSQYGKNRR